MHAHKSPFRSTIRSRNTDIIQWVRNKGLASVGTTTGVFDAYAYVIFYYAKWPLGIGQQENKGRITITEDDLSRTFYKWNGIW